MQATDQDRHGYIAEKRSALVDWEGRLDEIASGTARSSVAPMEAGTSTGRCRSVDCLDGAPTRNRTKT